MNEDTPENQKQNIITYMCNRHGNVFMECLENNTLNKDYSKHPTQVLMKHSIPQMLIDEIIEYNNKNGTNYGYCFSSLFALRKMKNPKGEMEYIEEFELCKEIDGINILKGLFECIISNNRMKKTIMKNIENTQTAYSSRKSTVENPKLFIVYLPTHTGNNTISMLQKTVKAFLETNHLWDNYNIEYSNSTEDTGIVKEEYNDYIKTIMNNTKEQKKRGCILLLGNKGSVGITYHECDVTISLDDGHNLDNQKQRFSRALTEAEGKTVGINIDMNVQRTYLYILDVLQKHRKNTKTKETNAEILYYLYTHNVFLFDPQEFNNGNVKISEIMDYYEKETHNLLREIDDTRILENIVCDDSMRDYIYNDFKQKLQQQKQINGDLEGLHQDCPKGGLTKIEIDGGITGGGEAAADPAAENDPAEQTEIENLVNQTLEMCKSFLFPLLALISRSYKIPDFKKIFTDDKTAALIISLLNDKKIDVNTESYNIIVNIMDQIIDNNQEFVDNIREIYVAAPAHKLRSLIEKHFIPTTDEKKTNAEVPTPVKLVDEMLDKIPVEFWKTPHSVFEPCCGKGNFVLGIFDRFYEGLKESIEDEIERCQVIINTCIYYADITTLNVFITTELLKCHIQSYCGLEEMEGFEFHYHVGDTLKLDIKDKWGIDGFNAVVGNPPYQSPSLSKKKQ